ncbi:hypothetical protein [Streptomyces sp. NPDC048419]|uniref:hypothetical protein n=1 Tax=Streptomyces sp. NPDC048419 TaxID=3365547 RepID=UPI00371DFE26
MMSARPASSPSLADAVADTYRYVECAFGEVLVPVRTDLAGPDGSVLGPLRQEVAAARAIASPH